MAKYVCIGDIHGRNDLLQELLKVKDLEYPEHQLLFLGDYIDRGPDSFQVIEEIKKRVEAGAIALLGNHEEFMLNYYASHFTNLGHPWLLPNNGGRKTIASYQKVGKDYHWDAIFKVPNKYGHIQFLKSLPLSYETDEIWASHAPIHKDDRVQDDRYMLIWNYFEDEENAMDRGKLSICGHIHALSRDILTPRIFPQIIYADTGSGCAQRGPLSAVVIEDGKYVKFFQAVPRD